jgi:hypothetical protein
MDAMGMDERQREGWLRANRATLMIVGLIWLGMIARDLSRGEAPIFLIAMVPVIAGLRLALYRYYMR